MIKYIICPRPLERHIEVFCDLTPLLTGQHLLSVPSKTKTVSRCCLIRGPCQQLKTDQIIMKYFYPSQSSGREHWSCSVNLWASGAGRWILFSLDKVRQAYFLKCQIIPLIPMVLEWHVHWQIWVYSLGVHILCLGFRFNVKCMNGFMQTHVFAGCSNEALNTVSEFSTLRRIKLCGKLWILDTH